MEKVKLTKEQAEAIENTESRYGKDLTVIRHAERYFHDEDGCNLIELTTAEVAKALYIGYEVEETFKVGDWAVATYFLDEETGERKDVIGIIKNIHINEQGLEELDGHWSNFSAGLSIVFNGDNVRHATPEEIAEEKQRRWWAKHGREVWELKQGDILKDKRNGFLYEYQRIGDAFLGKTIRLARFNEGRYDFWKNDVTEHFKVVCFAEDRKDNA